MVKTILNNGYAYEVNGSVYLDVNKYNEDFPYGKLSGRNLEDTLENYESSRRTKRKEKSSGLCNMEKGLSRTYYALAITLGDGFPGWHLECSAMSSKYLDDTFDIHGGGMDLVFPHHEAEIAQSNACNKCDPAKYWMHNNMITINGQKMGKSLGNFITLKNFLVVATFIRTCLQPYDGTLFYFTSTLSQSIGLFKRCFTGCRKRYE